MTRRSRRRERAPDRSAAKVAPGGLAGGRFQPLDPDDVEQIVAAARAVLERTGIAVEPSPCRDLLLDAGCRADGDRVLIPERLVDHALDVARPEVLLAGRSPEWDLPLGGKRVFLGTGGQAVTILDLDGRVRPTRLADNYHIGRLVDTLDHIHFYMRPVVSRDLANEQIDVNQFYACLAATEKHVMANAYLPESVADIRALGDMLAGGADAFDARPPLSFCACWTVSPLRYATETVAVLDLLLDHNMPVVLSSAPQAGATAPAALAGTLVQIWAEQLSGIVYANLRRPGAAVVAGCVAAHVDLRSGAFIGGSGEFALLQAACAQIAQHLRLPVYSSCGISDSKVPDAQAGAEKGLTGLAVALAGANYVHHSAGFLESLLTVAYEQFVIDNDVNGAIMRTLRGIEVSDANLSVDAIDEVCRGPGHFLGHAQTLALMNSEYLYPTVMNRQSRGDWEERGGHDVREAARERARQILSSHWPQPIPRALDAEIRARFEICLDPAEMAADTFTLPTLAAQ